MLHLRGAILHCPPAHGARAPGSMLTATVILGPAASGSGREGQDKSAAMIRNTGPCILRESLQTLCPERETPGGQAGQQVDRCDY
jgi:hypothetical protein